MAATDPSEMLDVTGRKSQPEPPTAILSEVVWHFVLTPLNMTRYVITQRQDGPFADDIIGGEGHYYISTERMIDGVWQHVTGSTWSVHSTFKNAYTKMQMAIK